MSKDYLKHNPDGSITLCCRKNRCPVLSKESENEFKIVDDFNNSVIFYRIQIEETIEHLQSSFENLKDIIEEDEFITLENHDGEKVLLELDHLQAIIDAFKTFDE